MSEREGRELEREKAKAKTNDRKTKWLGVQNMDWNTEMPKIETW